MKTIKYTLATLMVAAIVAVVLVGCKKDEKKAEKAEIRFDHIGELHNALCQEQLNLLVFVKEKVKVLLMNG